MANKVLDQDRQYKLLDLLQLEVQTLPFDIQQKLSFDLLAKLSACLLDAAIYEIIKDLEEIQNLTEKSLFTKRQQLTNYHKELRQAMREKHNEEKMVCKEHNLTLLSARQADQFQDLEKRVKKEVHDFHKNLLAEIDRKVTDQQNTLQQASVPGFFITNDSQDVNLQMAILQLIRSCSEQCDWL